MPTQPIYGIPSVIPCSDSGALLALETLISSLSAVVDQCYPATKITPNVAYVTLHPTVSAPIFVRLLWKKGHPGMVFNASLEHCYQLMDLYYSLGILEWQPIDPVLVSLFAKKGVTV